MLWKLLGGAAILGLAAFAIVLFGNARHAAGEAEERGRWQARRVEDVRADAERQIANAERGAKAAAAQADRMAALLPLFLQSERSVNDYAKTAAGAVLCRDADRVREIDRMDELVFPAAATTARGGEALHPDAAAPAG
nr:hypothetical protein [Sphingomonas sp. Y57]